MVPGGTTEIIWHFIGYLNLVDDIARARIEYQAEALKLPMEDYGVPLDETSYNVHFDEFRTFPMTSPFVASVDGNLSYPYPYAAHLRTLHEPDPEHFRPSIISPAYLPNGFGGGGGSGGGYAPEIQLHYRDGGEQLLADFKQTNALNDNDLLTVAEGTDVTSLHHIDIDVVVQQMLQDAKTAVPADLVVTHTDTTAVANFIDSRDTATAENGGSGSEFVVEPGRYVNGELQTESMESNSIGQVAVPEVEFPPIVDDGGGNVGNGDISVGQWAQLGGNEGLNAGLIVDLNEACRTMIVLGDYFKTDANVQTNSYIDNDQIDVTAGLPSNIIAGANRADNIAEFTQEPGVYTDTTGVFAGYNWNVAVVNGNFYDLNLLTQQNYLCDNDIIVQDSTMAHYEVIAGANIQYNISTLFDGDFKYDVIIIAGSYHGANLIYQNNILLDDDIIRLAADGDTAGTQDVEAGNNTLLNNAMIVTYGDQEFLPLGDGMNDLASALADGTTTLDPNTFGDVVSGNGSDTLNVLYIAGDYYDINAIWQVNIFADVDTAIQYLHPNETETNPPVQSATIGGNALTNDAAIVDVGATMPFIGGNVYNDAILVQADLITEDDDHVVHADPNVLVNELIAFTTPENEEEQVPLSSTVTFGHDDTMGHVLA